MSEELKPSMSKYASKKDYDAAIAEWNRRAAPAVEPDAHPSVGPVTAIWTDAKLRGIASDYFADAKDWPAAMLCLRHLLMEQASAKPEVEPVQSAEPVVPEQWIRYVAGMIETYLGWPLDDPRTEAIAGIIELAALAMGLYADGYRAQYREGEGWVCVRPADESCPFQSVWAPLTDDGDALRLAVRLGLVVDCSRPSAGEPFNPHHFAQDDYKDPCAATRRAIVRAAAEIGRRMKEAAHG